MSPSSPTPAPWSLELQLENVRAAAFAADLEQQLGPRVTDPAQRKQLGRVALVLARRHPRGPGKLRVWTDDKGRTLVAVVMNRPPKVTRDPPVAALRGRARKLAEARAIVAKRTGSPKPRPLHSGAVVVIDPTAPPARGGPTS